MDASLPLRRVSPLNAAIARYWSVCFSILPGLWVGIPWLAPVFAKLGWWAGANTIYTGWVVFCHQLPERAGRLFGYEAATCFRCTALYGAMFLAGLLFAGLRLLRPTWGRLQAGIPWPVFALCSLPILLDGLSHMVGLRADNAWFAALTGGIFGSFSVGDGVGSLNWWLRVASGTLFGVAAVFFVYPRIDRTLVRDLLG